MCLQYILDKFTPSIVLSLLPPLLEQFQQVFILLFSYMDTKYIHHIHPHSSFPCAHPPPSSTHPWKRPIFSLLPFIFLKCVLIVQGSFTLVLQTCIYHALIKLTPPSVTYSFSITMFP
jgi:hypothetical protein